MIDQSFGHYHMSLDHYEKLKKADIKINDMYFPTENSNKNLSNNIKTTIKNKHLRQLQAAASVWWRQLQDGGSAVVTAPPLPTLNTATR